jgi:hypothetical protein
MGNPEAPGGISQKDTLFDGKDTLPYKKTLAKASTGFYA